MSAMAAKALEDRRSHLAAAGSFHFVCEFKRKLRGYPWWKGVIFYCLMKVNRFASARLKLPTIIRYDDKGAFWTEYGGGFTDIALAHQAIETRKAEYRARGWDDVQFELTEGLPLNGLTPAQTGTYCDQDFVGEYIPEFIQIRQGPVMCPFKKSICTPEEVLSRADLEPLFRSNAGVDATLNR
jgi:hypothetical protein